MSEEMKNLNEQPEETPVEKKEEVAVRKPLDKKTLAIIGGAAAAVVIVVAIILAVVLGGPKAPALNDYTLGLGVAIGEFKNNEANATIATVVLDKDGKIVLCRIDAVQNKYTVGDDAVTFSILKTKMELGDDYKMAIYGASMDNNGDGIVKEWYDQTKAFEKHVIGMTAAQVEALETQVVNNHNISTDNALLTAGCTIDITGFKAAVVKACNDEFKVSFKSEGKFTLGIAANSKDDGSKVDGAATVKMNVDIAAAVVEDGKIVASLNDAIQPQIVIEDGVVTSKSVGKGEGILKTKRELKADYKMAEYGASMDNNGDGKVLEWYIQSAEFSKYVVGKTAAQVEALETQFVNNHNISTDNALLTAGCTIEITGIKAVVAESVTNAR